MIAAIEPVNQVTIFRDDEDGRRNAVNSNNVSGISYGQTSNNVNVSDGDLLDVVTVLCEDLHAGTLVATVANDKLAVGSHDCDFTREPELTLLLAWNAEVELEASILFKDLKDETLIHVPRRN